VCRSTGHVRVGLGASRQDVNVSVRGGRRVEIKGVPKAGWAPALVHGEAVRQVNLLALRDELHRRGFQQPDDLAIEHREVTDLLSGSSIEVLGRTPWEQHVDGDGRRWELERGAGGFCIRAVRLKGLAGTLGWPTQPDRTFADELRGRVRVIAALDQAPILLHSEEWPDRAEPDLASLCKSLGCADEDGLVVIWGAEEDTQTAAEEIRLRYADAIDGVPLETRQPFEDGSTDFERILPGPDRMYPDTDSPPQRVTRERVEKLRAPLPEPPWSREERYSRVGVPRPVIHYLIRRGGARLVDLVVDECGADLRRACFFFGERVKGLRRAGVAVDEVQDAGWCDLFDLFGRHPVTWHAWRDLVDWLAANPAAELQTEAELAGFGQPPEDWRDTVADLAGDGPFVDDDKIPSQQRYLMGLVMDELRGRVPASDVESLILDLVGTELEHEAG
jgi:glutamyl-tRNA(Gln) amidotransferase subunit E